MENAAGLGPVPQWLSQFDSEHRHIFIIGVNEYSMSYEKIRINKSKTRDKHRIIMEESLGRKLNRNEVVHHINGNKKDNSLENLELMSLSEHSKLHHLGLKLNKEIRNKISLSLRKPYSKSQSYCTRCKIMKSHLEFHKESRRWNGLRNYCKPCTLYLNKKR